MTISQEVPTINR